MHFGRAFRRKLGLLLRWVMCDTDHEFLDITGLAACVRLDWDSMWENWPIHHSNSAWRSRGDARGWKQLALPELPFSSLTSLSVNRCTGNVGQSRIHDDSSSRSPASESGK